MLVNVTYKSVNYTIKLNFSFDGRKGKVRGLNASGSTPCSSVFKGILNPVAFLHIQTKFPKFGSSREFLFIHNTGLCFIFSSTWLYYI